jgi:hypothetical protein
MKKTDPKAKKKRKFKILIWLGIDLIVAAVILGLILHKPARYDPLKIPPSREVSPHLTNELLPQLYNNAQLEEPFDLVVTQKAINDIVARADWPIHSEGAALSAPAVLFVPGSVVLMGTATLKGVDFVVTIALTAHVDANGLLGLKVAKVKVGAMNITPLARVVASKMYRRQVEDIPVDEEDIRAQIAAALLNNESFDPVLDLTDLFEGRRTEVRIEKVAIEYQKLTLRLVPL